MSIVLKDHIIVEYGMLQHGTVWYSTVWYGTVPFLITGMSTITSGHVVIIIRSRWPEYTIYD